VTNCLQLRNPEPDFRSHELKIDTRVTPGRGTFAPVLAFCAFHFQLYGTDGQIDGHDQGPQFFTENFAKFRGPVLQNSSAYSGKII